MSTLRINAAHLPSHSHSDGVGSLNTCQRLKAFSSPMIYTDDASQIEYEGRLFPEEGQLERTSSGRQGYCGCPSTWAIEPIFMNLKDFNWHLWPARAAAATGRVRDSSRKRHPAAKLRATWRWRWEKRCANKQGQAAGSCRNALPRPLTTKHSVLAVCGLALPESPSLPTSVSTNAIDARFINVSTGTTASAPGFASRSAPAGSESPSPPFPLVNTDLKARRQPTPTPPCPGVAFDHLRPTPRQTTSSFPTPRSTDRIPAGAHPVVNATSHNDTSTPADFALPHPLRPPPAQHTSFPHGSNSAAPPRPPPPTPSTPPANLHKRIPAARARPASPSRYHSRPRRLRSSLLPLLPFPTLLSILQYVDSPPHHIRWKLTPLSPRLPTPHPADADSWRSPVPERIDTANDRAPPRLFPRSSYVLEAPRSTPSKSPPRPAQASLASLESIKNGENHANLEISRPTYLPVPTLSPPARVKIPNPMAAGMTRHLLVPAPDVDHPYPAPSRN
ncbi:hypothetical protein R3P38DRAFT_3445492 [Favolaschia claudopus]|uniref:Uncharacterized protein n=1 Tax=Favolaschia claudopus TaxID=2862362 RepID=A0AAV9ZND4_9AGAR